MTEVSKQDSELDCSNRSRGVWLVKVPKYVSEAWEKVPSDAEAAKLRIEKSPGMKPNVSLSLSTAAMEAIGPGSGSGTDKRVVPKEYKLAVATMSAQTLAIFSQAALPPSAAKGGGKGGGKDKDKGKDASPGDGSKAGGSKKAKQLSEDEDEDDDMDFDDDDDDDEDGGSSKAKKRKSAQAAAAAQSGKAPKLSLEGRVVQRAECRPVADLAYMKHKAQMIRDSSKPQRTVIQLDRAVQSYKPIADHRHNIEFEKAKKTEGKKARGERDKVMEAVFAAFEKHQYYNLKDLCTITNQPVTFMKELLKEFCVYNTKAPHKNMWELKPEFRHYKPKDEDDDDDD